MSQSASEVPIHNLQRKSAIATGSIQDHAGAVEVRALENFDLQHTIFNTLEGALPRYVIKTRIAKEHIWPEARQAALEGASPRRTHTRPLPPPVAI